MVHIVVLSYMNMNTTKSNLYAVKASLFLTVLYDVDNSNALGWLFDS